MNVIYRLIRYDMYKYMYLCMKYMKNAVFNMLKYN